MRIPTWVNTVAIVIYATSGTVLTTLVHENVISGQLSVDIAAIITTFAAAFHGGQAIASPTNSLVSADPGAAGKHES